jgi:hypothetical protein
MRGLACRELAVTSDLHCPVIRLELVAQLGCSILIEREIELLRLAPFPRFQVEQVADDLSCEIP